MSAEINIRVSTGSAIALGLKKGKLKVKPGITYLLMDGVCNKGCAYCTQGTDGYLSRVYWPKYPLNSIKGKIGDFCLQTIEKEGMEEEMGFILNSINCRQKCVAITFLNELRNEILEKNGVKNVGIGLDACTKELYQKYKPKLSWGRAMESMNMKSKFNIVCHLILGLGEKDVEFLKLVEDLSELSVKTALFAYTPVRNKKVVGHISLKRYRTLQFASFLIESAQCHPEDFEFDRNGKLTFIPQREIRKEAFLTRGCENCNRPFYNERVGGEQYNLPCLDFNCNAEDEIRDYIKSIFN